MGADTCEHRSVFYTPAVNEDGWTCTDCSKKLGFRPDLDTRCTDRKVDGVMFLLDLDHLVGVSNGTQGEIITANVACQATKLNRFDQYTLIKLILADPNLKGHDDYWAAEAEKWLAAETAGQSHEKPVDQQLREAGAPSLFDQLVDQLRCERCQSVLGSDNGKVCTKCEDTVLAERRQP